MSRSAEDAYCDFIVDRCRSVDEILERDIEAGFANARHEYCLLTYVADRAEGTEYCSEDGVPKLRELAKKCAAEGGWAVLTRRMVYQGPGTAVRIDSLLPGEVGRLPIVTADSYPDLCKETA